MSWQAYVDDQLLATKMVSQAVICGHDGNAWATSAGFSASPAELKTLATNFGKTDVLAMNGVTIAGQRYMYLSGDDKVLRCKKGTSGIHVMKTVQAYIVAVYHDPIVAPQCAQVTEKLGEYLISVGF